MLQIREILYSDKGIFINTMIQSKDFHYPFADAPRTGQAFDLYFENSQTERQKCYLVFNDGDLVGVFNISEIVKGCFQSAYLGYYANKEFAGKGLMSMGLKLVLERIFLELKLHRIEANIQPTNTRSLLLVKKHGFIKEGFSQRYLKINNQWCDHFRFALTYEDWLSSRCVLE